MAKIPKNRQDTEMIGDVPEQTTFEHAADGATTPLVEKTPHVQPVAPAYAAFLTPELQESLGKALLALKLKLYKDGMVDYTLKVSTEAEQIVVKAVPLKKKLK